MTMRDAKGRLLPGHGGLKKKGSKHKITQNMLNEFFEYDEAGGNTPFKLWRDILNGKHDEDLKEMIPKEAWTIRLKASELMARYIYDASFDTEEASNKLEMSAEQIEALKSAFPGFKK